MKVLSVSAVFGAFLLSGCASYHIAGAQVASMLEQTGEVTTHAVRYVPDSAELDSKSKPVLDAMVQYLKSHPTIHLEILDDTENIDGAGLNLSISQKRAETVKTYFVAAGIDASRVTAAAGG
jgi:outer membrane protein OmpA-like peptidoglycan-associated protein